VSTKFQRFWDDNYGEYGPLEAKDLRVVLILVEPLIRYLQAGCFSTTISGPFKNRHETKPGIKRLKQPTLLTYVPTYIP
jgi:hypothetical protein